MSFPCAIANEKSPFQVMTFRRNTNAWSCPHSTIYKRAKLLTVVVGLAFE